MAIIIIISALALVDFSRAGDPQISMSWTYSNAPSDLAGFHLYINDQLVQDINVPGATSWTGPATLNDGTNKFELAPYDDAGQEGPKSAPYNFDWNAPPDNAPTITDVHVVE